jgi:DNA topoisomerase-6 subunit A
MAKKPKKADVKPAVLTAKDKKTLSALRELSGSVVQSAERSRAPQFEVPSRSLSNVKYNQSRGIIEMLSGTNRRELFNLAQAKSFMQTVLVGSKCKGLIEQGKTASIRQIFYLCKHTIKGTSENTFDQQEECDPIIEDVEVMLNTLREELHVFASNRGTMVGNIIINDSGDTIDCSRLGSGGYSIPSIVEPDIIEFAKCDATFILHVEKDTVWRRFNEDKFWM